ncbi:hypothetical protein [Coxiella burnetii]|uniref:Hypothetical membrane spanning protein n=2 Tax=Coxiella burnetii TaxID=777 RepID=Q83AN7_COXBU|nr:hypothetical protein [Coxiella burnetii]NP_820823.1 membrane-spanning protein [Coxiella burnetii RSA 493]AAO91337.1 hypothetical membrane spanning protein [Coxiella burnetii RSA 493]ABS77654.1 hypothetical membrane spanning protein [Coxiella burnetii Dugway 5J108-111]ABX77720.1 hypothetical protein COXBURSA331_A2047 [Coxiella burnetii RSA 331]AIT62490.1 putative membrane spanning protein [Coxiella burnetii str. Namibia]ARI66598.1 hypothetical protein B7L74_09505 [Coxiella burnetii]
MWLADHVTIDTIFGTWIAEKWKMPIRPLFVGLYASNAIDIDHAFDLGQDTGFVNSLTIHTFHIYGGFILASFILYALIFNFSKTRYWAIAIALGLAIHLWCDAIAFWVHYNIIILGGMSILLVLFLPLILKCFSSPIPIKNLWFLVGVYWIADTAQRTIFYFDFKNAYKTIISAWIVPIILLGLFIIFANFYIKPWEKPQHSK